MKYDESVFQKGKKNNNNPKQTNTLINIAGMLHWISFSLTTVRPDIQCGSFTRYMLTLVRIWQESGQVHNSYKNYEQGERSCKCQLLWAVYFFDIQWYSSFSEFCQEYFYRSGMAIYALIYAFKVSPFSKWGVTDIPTCNSPDNFGIKDFHLQF